MGSTNGKSFDMPPGASGGVNDYGQLWPDAAPRAGPSTNLGGFPPASFASPLIPKAPANILPHIENGRTGQSPIIENARDFVQPDVGFTSPAFSHMPLPPQMFNDDMNFQRGLDQQPTGSTVNNLVQHRCSTLDVNKVFDKVIDKAFDRVFDKVFKAQRDSEKHHLKMLRAMQTHEVNMMRASNRNKNYQSRRTILTTFPTHPRIHPYSKLGAFKSRQSRSHPPNYAIEHELGARMPGSGDWQDVQELQGGKAEVGQTMKEKLAEKKMARQ